MDELEKIIQSDPKEKQKSSSFAARIFSKLSVIARARHELDIYMPWAAGFENEKATYDEAFEWSSRLPSSQCPTFNDTSRVIYHLRRQSAPKEAHCTTHQTNAVYSKMSRVCEGSFSRFCSSFLVVQLIEGLTPRSLIEQKKTSISSGRLLMVTIKEGRKFLYESFRYLLRNDEPLERTPGCRYLLTQ